jgi:hypothetical protein
MQDRWRQSGHPVVSAGSFVGGQTPGVEVEHPTPERPLHLVCCAFGADEVGYPHATLMAHHCGLGGWRSVCQITRE